MNIKTLLFLLILFFYCSSTSASSDNSIEPTPKKVEHVQKFLHSKFGQWLIRTAINMAERKMTRNQAKIEKAGAKGKVLKEKDASRTNISRLSLAGLIVLIVGLGLGLLGLFSGGLASLLVAVFLAGPIFLIGLILFLVGVFTATNTFKINQEAPERSRIEKSNANKKKMVVLGYGLICLSVLTSAILLFSITGIIGGSVFLIYTIPIFLLGLVLFSIGITKKTK